MTDEQPKKDASKSPISLKEEDILKFWNTNGIFKKSLEKAASGGDFVFYDGPPFATGLPHYGHILPGTIKDVIPRYQTMNGKRVLRKWGWDCHGLPVENLIEKELGLKNKKDIEDLGVEKFNEAARASVLRYDKEWKEIIPRSGRWVDMDDAYLTMNPPYMESVWWSFKTLFDKGLVYQGFKSMHLCPHCETTLANFEVNQGYKDIVDLSVYAKFELTDEPGTFVIAWTTTPWTLPGNTALAVKGDVMYVKAKKDGALYVVAKDLAEKVLKENFEIAEEFTGDKLVGKSYKPLFDYYKDAKLAHKENIWKIWAADFVTTEDGTGIVHIAPGFGEDDYQLSLTNKIPFIQHVARNGTFKKEVTDFAGLPVKPRDSAEDPVAHQKGDVEIIKYLAGKGTLFAKEKFTHSYPHCWRCDTPLLNYATESWFIKVTDLKDKLVAENKKVNWVPEEVGDGRFGKWLEGARDWAVSRSRYWGSTLPVWRCEACEKIEVIGSLEELKKKIKRNDYYVMRHGEADHNIQNVLNSDNRKIFHLTEKGKTEIKMTAKSLKGVKFDRVFVSPLIRAQETAALVAEALGISKDKIITDDRLHEFGWGDFEGKAYSAFLEFEKDKDIYSEPLHGGECYNDAKRRTAAFLYDIDAKYKDETMLVVGHGLQVEVAEAIAQGADKKRFVKIIDELNPEPGEVRKIEFTQLPHDRNFDLDLHRPYVDEVVFSCACGGTMKKIPEVFDTWYESGSMPYGQFHYPFENLEKFNPAKGVRFPADFIGEGADQTRGWFYTLLVLSTGLFGKAPYKTVVVNGQLLAEDGKKMSKRLKNYPDINYIFDRYGADALRYFLMASPAVRADDMAFSEKGVDEVAKKIIMRLGNVQSFFELYKPEEPVAKPKAGIFAMFEKTPALDRWILSRLHELRRDITINLDHYQIDKAARPLADFVDDLSTWYLRRSRERLKGEGKDKKFALETLCHVLQETSKLIAPFMPFLAEDLYQKMKGSDGKESVHLEDWPKQGKVDENLLASMKQVRAIVSLGLEARSKANIKVRQPLAKLTVKTALSSELNDLIKDEVNVKEVVTDKNLATEISLDTNITPELKEEGVMRDLVRAIQEMRKNQNLNPKDEVVLTVATNEAGKALIEKYKPEIAAPTAVKEIVFGEASGETITADTFSFTISLSPATR